MTKLKKETVFQKYFWKYITQNNIMKRVVFFLTFLDTYLVRSY